LGLIIDGNIEQAKNNCEVILFLIKKYGYMPNGNQVFYLNRSQPPYLSMMIFDVYAETKDIEWLKKCLPVLEMEYYFWMSKRVTPEGLNHYSNFATDEEKYSAVNELGKRLGENFDTSSYKSNSEKLRLGSHFLSECESGWDFNPRFERRCEDFSPVELNCNLYMYEKNFAYFYKQLKNPDSDKWLEIAEKRKKLVNKYLFNLNDSLFYDYDYVNKKQSRILSSAIFNLLWSNMASDEQAKVIVANLPKLEYKYGISACAPGNRQYLYQWDYPNGWPCIQYIASKGLLNYGYNEDAKRVAYKYVSTVSINFERTNNLWEKYNIVDGTTNVSNEYTLPTMMGWTAGVFVNLSLLVQ